MVAIAIGAVVVIGGVAALAAGLSGGHHPTPTTVAPPPPGSTTPSTSPNTSPHPTTPPNNRLFIAPGNLEPNAPFSNCTDLAPGQRGIQNSTDEVVCVGSDVGNEGAAQVFYATFASSAAAETFLATAAQGPGSAAVPCSGVSLGPGTAFCGFTDNSSNSGSALMSIGSNFTFASGASTANNCAGEGLPSTDGDAIILFTYAGSNVVGGAFACQASTTPLATMRTGLYNSDFELNNQ